MKDAEMPTYSELRCRRNENVDIDYLVGGFRISTAPDSNTPGPRTHILGFTRAVADLGFNPRIYLTSMVPFLSRFSNVKESDYADASNARLWMADAVRLIAGLWSGLWLAGTSLMRKKPGLIYERCASFQSLTSFHLRRRGVPRVLETNGIMSRETAHDRKVLKNEWLVAAIERHVLRRADLVVAVSAALAREVHDFAGVDLDRILVVPNGVSPQLVTRPIHRSADRIRLGFSGSVVAWQRVDLMISALAELASIDGVDTPLTLEIIGDGPEVPRLKALVESLNVGERVTFYGRMSHEDALDVMSEWDIGIAGHAKTTGQAMYHSPLKLYEYAALGMQIICTDSDDARNLRRSGVHVHIYSSEQELVHVLADSARGMNKDVEEIAKLRRDVLREHGWEERARRVLNRVAIALPELGEQ